MHNQHNVHGLPHTSTTSCWMNLCTHCNILRGLSWGGQELDSVPYWNFWTSWHSTWVEGTPEVEDPYPLLLTRNGTSNALLDLCGRQCKGGRPGWMIHKAPSGSNRLWLIKHDQCQHHEHTPLSSRLGNSLEPLSVASVLLLIFCRASRNLRASLIFNLPPSRCEILKFYIFQVNRLVSGNCQGSRFLHPRARQKWATSAGEGKMQLAPSHLSSLVN